MQEKKEIRKKVREFRKAHTDEQIKDLSHQVAERIFAIPEYQQASCVYAYMDYKHEVMTGEIITHSWELGKRVAVPRVTGQELVWYYIRSWEDLESGYDGILEPRTDLDVADERDAFFVMPGVAFDRDHHRVGYGGGFYDRYLEKPNTHYTAAIAFEFQLFDAVPFEAHDILPRAIVTEKTIY